MTSGPHWIDGTPATPAEIAEWLAEPAEPGQRKHLDMYLECSRCRHIRFQIILDFERAGWRLRVRKKFARFRAALYLLTHWSCEQCVFNRKVRGL